MILQPRDFKTQLEYEIYFNTKNWTINRWSVFRNEFCTDYFKDRDYANSLIWNKLEDKDIKSQGYQLMLTFNMKN